MFDYKYLTKEHLKGFNKYKYSAIDTSPLSQYVMHPTWNTIVKVIPRSIAPNLITFAGFVCMVVAVLLLTVYDYDFYAAGGRPGLMGYECEIPNWLFTLCSILIFLAYNLDGVDGKQARRIGVSGPLGELFDHGLDSYIVFLIPYTIISIFGRDPVFSVSCLRGFLIVISVVMNFYVSHCEKYNTGTLYLPWSYDLSMWVCSGLFLAAGLYGPGYYKYYMFRDVTFAQVLEIVIHSMGAITTYPVAVYNVYLSYKNRTGLRYPILEAVKPVWSMFVMTAAVVFWAIKSPNAIIEQHPRAFIFMYGTLFSNISLYWSQALLGFTVWKFSVAARSLELCPVDGNRLVPYYTKLNNGIGKMWVYNDTPLPKPSGNIHSRLIIAEMSHSRCELVSWMTWPLLSGIVTSLNQPHLESIILHILLVVFVLSHVHYGICVVRQICRYLQINCFTVQKKIK